VKEESRAVFELSPDAPEVLGALPSPDDGDIILDMEGDPFVDDGQGREYLFGIVCGPSLTYHDWWAHDKSSQKGAFQAVVSFIAGRRCRCPAMHIYHYGTYEVTALKRLANVHGVFVDEVDEMVDAGVFVDLLPVMRKAFVLGTPYGLKHVEGLFRSSRTNAVADAQSSLVQYERWLSEPDGSTWQESKILHELREYNQDDCFSTQQLLDWLRLQSAKKVQCCKCCSTKKGKCCDLVSATTHQLELTKLHETHSVAVPSAL